MRRATSAFERKWNYDASYMHELIDVSPRAAWMFSRAAAIGNYRKDVPLAAWAAAETLYVVLHAAQGERFDAERFGPQWRQALGLIGVHAVVLGAPTGIVAGVLLQANAALRRR